MLVFPLGQVSGSNAMEKYLYVLLKVNLIGQVHSRLVNVPHEFPIVYAAVQPHENLLAVEGEVLVRLGVQKRSEGLEGGYALNAFLGFLEVFALLQDLDKQSLNVGNDVLSGVAVDFSRPTINDGGGIQRGVGTDLLGGAKHQMLSIELQPEDLQDLRSSLGPELEFQINQVEYWKSD